MRSAISFFPYWPPYNNEKDPPEKADPFSLNRILLFDRCWFFLGITKTESNSGKNDSKKIKDPEEEEESIEGIAIDTEGNIGDEQHFGVEQNGNRNRIESNGQDAKDSEILEAAEKSCDDS